MNRGNRHEEHLNYYFRNRDRILSKQIEYNKRPEVKEYQKKYQKEYYQKVKVRKELARLKKLQEDLKNKPEIQALIAKDEDSDYEQQKDWKEEPDIDWESLELPELEDQRGKSTHQRVGGKGGRPPRPFWNTSKLDSEEVIFGMSSYRYSRIKANCPLGFFQRPEGENPFRLTFE